MPLELVITYACPPGLRGGAPLETVAGLPGGGAAAGGDRAVTAWAADAPQPALHACPPTQLRGLMHLLPLDPTLLVGCYQEGLVGLSLIEGRETAPLMTERWATARCWAGATDALVVLGDDEALFWSARTGETLRRLSLEGVDPNGVWNIILATAELLVLHTAPDASGRQGLVVVDIATGEARGRYRGLDEQGLTAAVWLGGERYATIEDERRWRIWTGGPSPVAELELDGRSLGGPWLGGDVALIGMGGNRQALVDVGRGVRSRPITLKHNAAGIRASAEHFAVWRTAPRYRPIKGKGVLYVAEGPRWRPRKLALPAAPAYGMSLGPGVLGLLPFGEQAIQPVRVDPLEVLPAVPLPAPALGGASTGAAAQPGHLLQHPFQAAQLAGVPGFGEVSGADLLVLHADSVGRYRRA